MEDVYRDNPGFGVGPNFGWSYGDGAGEGSWESCYSRNGNGFGYGYDNTMIHRGKVGNGGSNPV